MAMNLADIYTIKQAAQKIGLSEQRTRLLAHEFGLLRRKVGSSYVLDNEDIAALKARPGYTARRGRRYDRHGKRREE